MKREIKSLWRYLAAFVFMSLAVALRMALIPLIGISTAYLTVFPAIAVVAILFGVGPALFAGVFGALACEVWMIEPLGVLKVEMASLIRGLFSIITAAATGFLARNLKEAKKHADQQADAARMSEAELRQTTKLLHSILENAVDPIYVKDVGGRYMIANSATARALGAHRLAPIGKTPSEVMGISHEAVVLMAHDREVLNTGKASMYEEVLTGEDGLQIYMTSRSPLLTEEGEVTGIIGIARNITERKRVELEVRQAKEAAEEANLTKSQFLATMSHELRTPLNSILGFSELLAQPELDEFERRDYATRVRKNGAQLTRLIDEILDLSKIESGKLELEELDAEVGEVLTDVIGAYAKQAEAKGLALTVSIDPDLPRSVVTDPTRLRQILSNLIGNAIKFTASGSVQVHALLSREHGLIRFVVEDTGEGVSHDQVERIFEPFVQADSSHTRRYGGTGLGLVLSRKLARALGGDVGLVKSIPGEGSVFEATVAFKEAAVGARKTKEAARSDRTNQGRMLEGIRVLVADDAADNRVLISRMLSKLGAKVEVAEDGPETIDKAIASEFDVVLMDIQMPGMDGYEATRILRSRGMQGPIVALTAYAMRSDYERSMAAGCSGHITKPVKRDELVSAILTICRNPALAALN